MSERRGGGDFAGDAPGTREAAKAKVRLLGAGTILPEALAAAELLERDWQVPAEVYSVTSFTELRREAMGASRSGAAGRQGRGAVDRATTAFVRGAGGCRERLREARWPISSGPGYAIRMSRWGPMGSGRSDTRERLRKFFEVDRHSITVAALHALGDARKGEAMKRYGIKGGFRGALQR